jgi:hypothetical protein
VSTGTKILEQTASHLGYQQRRVEITRDLHPFDASPIPTSGLEVTSEQHKFEKPLQFSYDSVESGK